MTQRKTKIICTLGKRTNNFAAILEMLKSGMDICRINAAQVDDREQMILIEMIRKAAKVSRRKCGIYIDLHGPKIKVGRLERDLEDVKIKAGESYLFYCKKKFVGNEQCMGIECSDLAKHLKVGDHIIVDHGKAIFQVTGFRDEEELIA